MKKYKLIVEVDTNDGDMLEKSWDIEEETLLYIKSQVSKIDHKYGISKEDYCIVAEDVERYNLTEEDIDWWNSFLPSSEMTYGYARLERITVIPISEEEVLYQ